MSSNDTAETTSADTDSDQSSNDNSYPIDTRIPNLDVRDFFKARGTIPWLGINTPGAYPPLVDSDGDRFLNQSNPQPSTRTFFDALGILPKPMTNTVASANPFYDPETGGLDAEQIRDIHALDVETLEDEAVLSIEQLCAEADTDEYIRVNSHQEVIDPRRLVFNQLFDESCKFRWQIASKNYSPGNMQKFFREKLKAIQSNEHTAHESQCFGWISHYDYGGSVSITTIYPSFEQTVELDPEASVTLAGESENIKLAPSLSTSTNGSEDSSSLTIYYGDKTQYNFKGTQRLAVEPVIYIPGVDVSIPLPDAEFEEELKRKHSGNMVEDAIPWHSKILLKLDNLIENINKEIRTARLYAVDFETLEFTIEEFFRLIGIARSTDIREKAAQYARNLAEIPTAPSIWNLQLSLKYAIVEECQGAKAGQTYQEYEAVAGELLRNPSIQLQLAKKQYKQETDRADHDDSDKAESDEQISLSESLDDLLADDDLTENQITGSQAEEIEAKMSRLLPEGYAAIQDTSIDE